MGYSNDLRVRVIRVVEGGAAARAAARQFVIGDATAIRWAKRWRETGSFEAKSNKGRSRSPLKKHEEWLLGLVRQEPDLTLEEIQRRLLEERQQKAGLGSVWRFFDRHGISFKKKRSGGRAGSAWCCRGANGMGGRSTQARSRPPGLHRRNRHLNQNGAAARSSSTR
jgi:transposase